MTSTCTFVDVGNFAALNHATARRRIGDLLRFLRRKYGKDSTIFLSWVDNFYTEAAVLEFQSEAANCILQIGTPGTHVDIHDFWWHFIGLQQSETTNSLAAMSNPNEFDRLVVVTTDFAYAPLLRYARSCEVSTTLIAPATSRSYLLAREAGERIDYRQIDSPRPLRGLISPGETDGTMTALKEEFANARENIYVIDPYIDIDTVRLATWLQPDVDLVFISQRFYPGTFAEVAALKSVDVNAKLLKLPQNLVHDRWLRLDGKWLHSGSSIKDIGRKYCRISEVVDKEEIRKHEQMLTTLLSSATEVDYD
ncbi:hypothetical protein AB0M80_42475 [Amycolatopsis sp. NPDC051045]|uniref:hypothetical protein n=1 Tax=Amycolatopsis sp. NPDC051045 TaxID=3156922 RepID=UPI0034127DE7